MLFRSGEKDKAISFYQKAVASNNDIISPIFLQKIGLVYLSMGDYQKAINTFEELKKKYFNSVQAVDADKYIEYAKLK